MGKVRVLFPEEVKRGSDAHRDQHHPTDCANAEDEQVNHCPAWVANGCKNKECDRGGTSKSVDDSDDQWTQLLIEADSAKYSVKPA